MTNKNITWKTINGIEWCYDENNNCKPKEEPIKKTEESLPNSIGNLKDFAMNWTTHLEALAPYEVVDLVSDYLEHLQEQNTKDIAEMKLNIGGKNDL